jgi:DNA end-binding protein Ku
MRAIWKGAVTFGLVNVPVKLYSATEDHDVPLHQVHDADGGRIRYKRVCELDGEVVPYEHIDRAYDDGEHTVVITKEDLASLPAETNREIEVVEFVPSEQIDPIMYDRTYYLEPDSKSAKAYVLLRRTLEETDRTAVVKFALRQRTRLAALRVRDDVLVLQTLLWADEVREPSFGSLDEDVKVSSTELKMAQQLVTSFESDFTPEGFEDEYQVQLRQLIEAKIEQGEAVDTAETFGAKAESEEGADVIDLMEALRRSVESAKGGAKDDDKAKGKSKSGSGGRTGGTSSGGKGGRSKGASKGSKERVAR